MRIEYHAAIEAELQVIRSYYENQSPGLGGQFIDEFERQVLVLASRPDFISETLAWSVRPRSLGKNQK
jgi:hypothetical protein